MANSGFLVGGERGGVRVHDSIIHNGGWFREKSWRQESKYSVITGARPSET